MVNAHSAEDDIAAFAAVVGFTRKIQATTAGVQDSDANGPLSPGRYLIQAIFNGNAIIWISFGKFEKGVTIDMPNDVPAFPLSNSVLIAIEFHVRKGVDDRIGARTSTGTADVYITKVSRDL